MRCAANEVVQHRDGSAELTGLWRSVHAISARMSILKVEAEPLTGSAGKPASKQVAFVGRS